MSNLLDISIILIPLVLIFIVYHLVCGNKAPVNRETNNAEPAKTITQSPVVTITANYVLLDDSMKMDEGTKMSLQILAKRACIFIFVVVKDKDEANQLKPIIAAEFDGVIEPNRILYCQTAFGRASMARQLEPVAHLDYDPEAIHQASIFFPTVLIAPNELESPHAKWKSNSFRSFMTSGNTDFFNLLPAQ